MSEFNKPNQDEHALDLIIERALGLHDEQASDPVLDEQAVTEIELAAAMLDVALSSSHPIDIPAGLSGRLQDQIEYYPEQDKTEELGSSPVDQAVYPIQGYQTSTSSSRTILPWFIAAASLLVATVSVLMPSDDSEQVLDLNEQRLALIESTPSDQLLQWDWISTDDQAVIGEVIGDVVWSDSQNKGYMRISGLAVNDPSLEQYQLWIFDATNPTGALPQFGDGLLSQRPIDGGVFDVDSVNEVIIEIDAKLFVEQAAAFAITVEPPGGVVVSDRSRVPLLALAP